MDNGIGGDFEVILDTVGFNADINSHLATGLMQSLRYRFYLQAYNFNELAPGPASDIVYIYACGVPAQPKKPNQVATNSNTITIDWNEPSGDGGCSVHGYSVHIDDGEAGEFREANVQ